MYIFRDAKGDVLYVGKASNLKIRVRSYFLSEIRLEPKTQTMAGKVAKINHIAVESEIEALLLEADLIKRYRPKYNKLLKDDKNYKYIKITKYDKFPRLLTVRKTENDKASYYGPFPEGRTVNFVLRSIRRIFSYCDCSRAKFNRAQKTGKPCFYYDLGLCPGPCGGLISARDYRKRIRRIERFLSGKSRQLVGQLRRELEAYSYEQKYEEAAEVRDRIRSFEYITQSFHLPGDYLQNPNLVLDLRRKEISELKNLIGIRADRIEAYDISNIQSECAVGSMVVFLRGEAQKSDYRRFKIKTVRGISDVAMIEEVLKRRFGKGKNKAVPDLILIDGGKAQVSAAFKVLLELRLEVPLLGLAKRDEEIVTADLSIIRLPRSAPALHLLQRCRDEAHRFAQAYHTKLRSKNLLR